MAHYVYSTMTAGVSYASYTQAHNNMPVREHHVAIHGGANAPKIGTIYTPKGIVTQVSDEDMEFLLNHATFNIHKKNGFITHEKKEIKVEKAIEKMTQKDKSAPKTKEDFKQKTSIDLNNS